MSRSLPLLAGTALVLAGLAPAALAQDFKLSGLAQVWYTQMMDGNLRTNSVASYYSLRSEFQENGFSIRRTEVKVAGRITDDVKFEVMLDPSIKTDPAKEPSILQDAAIEYEFAPGFGLKVGQFKTLQTMEGLTSSSEILFAERSQLGRVFGDKRDRGAVLSCAFGDPKGFGAKLSLGAFNGMTDAPAKGKSSDANAQKDLVARLDMNVGRAHTFGAYTLQGRTDVVDQKGLAIAASSNGGWPNPAAIYDNKDKTTNVGAFYAFQNDTWIATAEVITGLLGRRYPTLAAAAPAVKREHLDQKFMGYYATFGYRSGNHTLLARYDSMDYNSGSDWYTAYNPYRESAPGVAKATDFTPRFREISLGYTYAFKPEKVKQANIKINYIARSKNFLAPYGPKNQSSEQGGDTLVAAFQIAF